MPEQEILLKGGAARYPSRVMVAPMAGVTDLPFRRTVHGLGRAVTEGEMVSVNPDLFESEESLKKIDFGDEPFPRIVQLLGASPVWMARAAAAVERRGADVIDINMGCPAKKICKTACGSALMRDEALAGEIIRAVTGAVSVPVTLKIRTGWDESHKNAVSIAKLAEDCGVSLITVHGRTRDQVYSGSAEYETVRKVVSAVCVPVIANGDIDSPEKAAAVIRETGAAGVMIGRGALGNPWLPVRTDAFLSSGRDPGEPSAEERLRVILGHLSQHLAFYGGGSLRTFRKHLIWYLEKTPGFSADPRSFFSETDPESLASELRRAFSSL